MKWDCEIGGQSFLFATNQQAPYRRETAEFRRQRIDQERETGEQSLDSGYWLRSQASFHCGAGLDSAEPLGVSPDEARFRYARSRGVDPWEPGNLSLLHDTDTAISDTTVGTVGCLGLDASIAYFRDSTFSIFTPGVGEETVTNNTTGSIRSMTATGTTAWVATASQLAELSASTPHALDVVYSGGTLIDFVRWVKQRLLVADLNTLTEVTDLSPVSPPATLPTPYYTHPDPNWRWLDAAEGPSGIYVAGASGSQSSIMLITATENNGALDLGVPATVAEMPRGETVNTIYSYLGAYLIVGTAKGVRVAQLRDDGSLALGPLIIETDGILDHGGVDFVAIGRFVWAAVGNDERESLWRIDLGTPLEGDLRFAVASDMDASIGVTGNGYCTSVTSLAGKLYFAVKGVGLVVEAEEFVTEGWLETGRIRMGTLQPKAWRDMTVMREADPKYVDSMEIRAYTSDFEEGPWSMAVSMGPSDDVTLRTKTGTIVFPELGPDLNVRIEMQPNLSGSGLRLTSPVFTGYQVSAIPAPLRSRLVSVPVACWDWETDRNGQVIGREGYSWQRLEALEELESTAAVVTFKDFTSGEVATAYVERVSFTRLTPPYRGEDNSGGVATVLLRLL